MGLVKLELAKRSLPDREPHNSRMFVDLCENIHIHFRELRIVFSLDEYFEFSDILSKSTEDVRSYLAQNPDYEERKYRDTIMVAGGAVRQRILLKNSPAPNRSAYFPNDFTIELQDESVVDEIHVHWRDYRFAMPRSHLKVIASAFTEAAGELAEFERVHEYRRKSHRDRAIADLAKEQEKYAGHETRIMGEVDFPVAEIRTRYDNGKLKFKPRSKYIRALVQKYAEGDRVFPLILSTEVDGSHCVIDGNHRLYAAKELKLAHVNCIVTTMTFAESEPFRQAEALLKRFDAETGYRYNVSAFGREYAAYKLSRYYTDHFYRIVNVSIWDRLAIKYRRWRRGSKLIGWLRNWSALRAVVHRLRDASLPSRL